MFGLLACACPSFADLTIDDPSGTVEGPIAAAVADFAAWSAREGVCVAEVEVTDDAWPAHPEAVAVHEDRKILVEPVTDLETVVRHELCHGLDAQEKISRDNLDTFPPEDLGDPAFTASESLLRQESFAGACEEPAPDLGLAQALDDACGTDNVTDKRRFLADHAWLDVPETPVDLGDVSPVATGLTLASFFPDAVGNAGERALFARIEAEDVLLTPVGDDGVAGTPLTLAVTTETAVLAATDADPVLLTDDGAAWIVDLETGTTSPFTLEDPPTAIERAVVSEGVLYATVPRELPCEGACADPVLRAWDLTGAAVPIEGPRRIRAFAPSPGGIDVLTWSSLAHYERSTDTWSEVPAPAWLDGLLVVGDRRVSAWQGALPWVTWDGSWAIAADPCETSDASTIWVPTPRGGLVLSWSGPAVRFE